MSIFNAKKPGDNRCLTANSCEPTKNFPQKKERIKRSIETQRKPQKKSKKTQFHFDRVSQKEDRYSESLGKSKSVKNMKSFNSIKSSNELSQRFFPLLDCQTDKFKKIDSNEDE